MFRKFAAKLEQMFQRSPENMLVSVNDSLASILSRFPAVPDRNFVPSNDLDDAVPRVEVDEAAEREEADVGGGHVERPLRRLRELPDPRERVGPDEPEGMCARRAGKRYKSSFSAVPKPDFASKYSLELGSF